MTLEQKSKGKIITDLIYKIFVVGGVGSLLIGWGANKKDTETRTFSTPELKVRAEAHLNHMPNDVDTYIAYKKLDSLTKQWAIDRIEEKAARKKQDSLIKRNATTIYQLKSSQEEQTRLTRQILNKLN